MKRFVLIASIFCTSVLMMAMPTSFVDEVPDRVDFEKDKVGELKDPRPRTVVSFLDAFYYAQSGMLEVCHEGLGNCVIYLVDSNNNVLEHQEIISMNYSVEYLSVPNLPGDYTLVVDSDAMFAYGVITVY